MMRRSQKRRSVMLVIHRYAERLLYGDMLDRDGFQTHRLSSLSLARDALLSDRPQVVMIELDEGFDEALDFIRWAKSLHPGLAVIAITAFPEAGQPAELAGADHCIQLPVPIAQMVQTVNRMARA